MICTSIVMLVLLSCTFEFKLALATSCFASSIFGRQDVVMRRLNLSFFTHDCTAVHSNLLICVSIDYIK